MRRLILLVLLGYGVYLYQNAFPTFTMRYRLTVEVEADGKPYSGSNVIEAEFAETPTWFFGGGGGSRHTGEATIVPVGEQGDLLFVLLGGGNARSIADQLPLSAFEASTGPEFKRLSGMNRAKIVHGKYQAPLAELPPMVRFRDLNDPKTVEKVDPANLEASFGRHARLLRASIEIVPAGTWPFNLIGITGEPLGNGIDEKLKWLPEYKNKNFDGSQIESIGAKDRFLNSMGSGYFKIGR